MGCTVTTTRVKVAQFCDDSSVQEESQLFRWNVKSVRYAIKDPTLRCAFSKYLEQNKAGIEFLTCYTELEDLKAVVWGKLNRLQSFNHCSSAPRSDLMRLITDAQHKMLGELAVPFEDFLESSDGWLGKNSKYDGGSCRANSPSSVFVNLSPVTTKRKTILSRDTTPTGSRITGSPQSLNDQTDFSDLNSLSV